MKLVSGWQKAWRWFSVQILAVVAVLPFAWEYIPHDVKSMVPLEWQPYIFSGFAALGIFGRMVKQGDDDA